jgi:5-methylcytosine-specific restriction endonuclease McrA
MLTVFSGVSKQMARFPSFYYSTEWQRIRKQHLEKHPYCCVCAQVGIRTRAQEVDHIHAARFGGLPLSGWNLQSLCKVHHSQKTSRGPEHGTAQTDRPFTATAPDGYLLPAGVVPDFEKGNRND